MVAYQGGQEQNSAHQESLRLDDFQDANKKIRFFSQVFLLTRDTFIPFFTDNKLQEIKNLEFFLFANGRIRIQNMVVHKLAPFVKIGSFDRYLRSNLIVLENEF